MLPIDSEEKVGDLAPTGSRTLYPTKLKKECLKTCLKIGTGKACA